MVTTKKTASGISYSVCGKGPALVLINGLSRSSSHWFGFEDVLSDRFTVISFDPRGIGESINDSGWNLTIEGMADDVREIIFQEQIESTFIYGFSLGGMVALTLALKHPKLVKKIVCVNSSVGGTSLFRIHPKGLLALAKGSIGRSDLHMELSNLLLGSELVPHMRRKAVESWNSIERRHGRPVLQTIKQLGAAIRFTNPRRLKQISVPALIICGANDRFVPMSNSRTIARLIPNSSLRCIPYGGHELHVDKPLIVKTLLNDFLL